MIWKTNVVTYLFLFFADSRFPRDTSAPGHNIDVRGDMYFVLLFDSGLVDDYSSDFQATVAEIINGLGELGILTLGF